MVNVQLRRKGVKRRNGIRQIRQDYNGKLPEEVINEGYSWARSKSPYYRGRVRDAIRKETTKRAGKLILDQPKRAQNRPYHLWMHGIGKYNIAPQIKTGDPHFMYNVQPVMKDKAREFMRKSLKKATK